MNQLIETQLSTQTALTAGATIPTGATIHRKGCNLSNNGSAISVKGSGYFKITVNLTIEPTAIDPMIVTLTDNGTAIATATQTPAGAGDPLNLTLIGVIFNACECTTDQIAMTVNTAGTVTASTVIVERM